MQREKDRDLVQVTGLSMYSEIPHEQLNAAAIRLAALCIQRRSTKIDLVELLEMVGCIGPELAAAATAVMAGDSPPLGGAELSPAEPARRAVASSRWLWCGRGLHRMVGANLWVSPTTGKRRCRPCGNEFDRQAKIRKKEARKAMTSTLSVMDQGGDTRIEWNADSPVEVAAARAAFKVAKDKGYLAYRTADGGGRGEVIHRFDPNAERIIMQPQNQGG